MPQLHGGLMGKKSSYQITNSVRLRASASAYFSRTFGTPTNNLKWTMSMWVKRGELTTPHLLFCAPLSGSSNFQVAFSASGGSGSGDYINYLIPNAGSRPYVTTPLYRDPSAHYHFVFVFDSANATQADRFILYVNGVRQTATTATVALNQACAFNQSGVVGAIGGSLGGYWGTASDYFDGLLSEVYFIDGQALTPSSFGQASPEDPNKWVPKAYTGTYGNNGFHLDFKDANLTAGSNVGLGKDVSGNGNYWNTNNISVTAGVTYDAMVDTPTNNYATLNPIVASAANISYAALRSGTTAVQGTMEAAVFAGAYWEVTAAGSAVTAGVISGTGTTNTTTVTANKVFGFRLTSGGALDYINITDAGSWTSITTGLSAQQFPYGITQAADWNFGQRPFIGTASGKALCTANLPVVAITNPRKHFDVDTYTGTGSVLNRTGFQFQPDLTWVKKRGGAASHNLFDAVRGVRKHIESDTTNAETTEAAGVSLTAFNSDGYSLGTDNAGAGQVNASGGTFAAWLWKANGAGVSNTDGSITSTVSANQTAGFSIVTYTGTGANATVGHGLGAVPKLIIVKQRTSGTTENWAVYNANLANTEYLLLNTPAAKATGATYWNSTTPSSTVFSVGSAADTNESAKDFVAYCFAEIPGYSKFGSYTGNGSADGPFVWCGFRPKYILVKNATTGGAGYNWFAFDSVRDTYNGNTQGLFPNLSDVESAGWGFDITANGFKVRNTAAGVNGNTNTLIFAAFAEFPFGGSNVSPSPAR